MLASAALASPAAHVRGPACRSTVPAQSQSQYSHDTVQSQYSHSTVTAQSQSQHRPHERLGRRQHPHKGANAPDGAHLLAVARWRAVQSQYSRSTITVQSQYSHDGLHERLGHL
eukprot:4635656-Pyramimonas_sp.AAC.2